ncbi:MAG: DUF6174 domain-containing protein [Flavobacteriaceae bacterium]
MFKKIVLLSFSIILFSCVSEDLSEFEIAKNKWESANINSYKIKERISCFCVGILQWELEVVNGEKIKVTYDEPEYSVGETYEDVLAKAKTIDDIFDFIESIDKSNVAFFNVEYDEEYGFPASISIDYNKNTIDDEIFYRFYDFTLTNN